MIDKKLLSKILHGKIQEFTINDEDNIDFIFIGDFAEWKTINIYELANLCKEWAFNMDRELMSYKRNNSEWVCFIDYDSEDINKAYLSDTEPDAIFKAGEYILKGRNSRVS